MHSILNRPVSVLVLHLTVLALAVFALTRVPVELAPEMDFPRLSIITMWQGASSEMVARSITLPVEETVSSLEGVKRISSRSSEGQSIVDVELQKNVNVDFVRLELMEKLSALAERLPPGASFPALQKYVPQDFRELQGFLSYNLYGNMGLAEIQAYAEEHIKPALIAINGVGAVRILGGAERQIYVLLDRQRMESMGISIGGVLNAINSAQRKVPAGTIEASEKREYVFVGNVLDNAHELNEIFIRNQSGALFKLKEVARVVDSIAAPRSIVRINGTPSVTLEIDRQPGSNTLSVASEVETKIDALRKTLPSSLSLVKIADKSRDMRMEIEELGNKAALSGLAIFLVIVLFFRNFFVSLLMVLSVGFSVAGGIIFLGFTGIGLNVITLAALALSLGIAIDNNVVVVENVHRMVEHQPDVFSKPDRYSPVQLISTASREVWIPLLAATLTTIGALAPVFFLPEDLRPYFLQFAETSAVVLISSVVVAFTLVPVGILILMRFKLYGFHGEGRIIHWLKKGYIPAVKWMVLHRRAAVLLVIWLIGFPIWLLPERIEPLEKTAGRSLGEQKLPTANAVLRQLVNGFAAIYNSTVGSEFYSSIRPYLDYSLGGATQLFFQHVYKGELWKFGMETYLVVYIDAPQGTPVERTDEFARQIENALAPNLKAIDKVTTRVSPEFASIRVDFSDQVARTAIPFIIKDNLTSLVAQTGGFSVSVVGFGPGFWSGGGAVPNYTVEVTGYNYEKVKEIAQNVSEMLTRNPRVDNIRIDRLPWQSENYGAVAAIRREELNKIGVDVSTFLNYFAANVSSELSRGALDIANEPVRLVVKYNDFQLSSIDNLGEKIFSILTEGPQTSGSKKVKISDLLTLRVDPVMPVIERENQQYIRYVTFDFKGPYEFGERCVDGVVKSVPVPPGYEIKRPMWFFEFEKKHAVPLILLSLLSLLVVFMVTASLYESYRKPFVIILSAPMSLIGLLASFYFFDVNFGRGGYAAVLFLIGISVNNGILLVDRISHAGGNLIKGVGLEGASSIASAAATRLRPILITALVAVAGFAPFLFTSNVYSFWYPFSVGIIGGIAVSTIMILLFTPAFYDLVTSHKRRYAK
ncbi:MAG: efflux RND transporter permease subunit [Bacteroidota bacterium]